MPRTASPKACFTCRKRKVKCGEELPACCRCIKAGLNCDRTSRLKIKRLSSTTFSHDDETPRDLLRQPHIADLFHVYIKDLAPWYDLNDQSCAFAKECAVKALDTPLLFSAIIAFAAIYSTRRKSSTSAIAEKCHAKCLKLLIALSPEDESIYSGTALAATCLLRSYEILSEVEDPNRHLFGASTLLPTITPSLNEQCLLTSGFWNYLREDITYSLIHRCQLKVGVARYTEIPKADDSFSNAMTLLVARAINIVYSSEGQRTNTSDQLSTIKEDLKTLQRNYKLEPFAYFQSDDYGFPTIKMLSDTQVAALHYTNVVRCILGEDDRNELAAEICGSSMSSLSNAVIVNSYGPICFTGQWLQCPMQQDLLVKWLKDTEKETAWSVAFIVKSLLEAWSKRMQVSASQLDSKRRDTSSTLR